MQPQNCILQKIFHVKENVYSRREVVAMEWLVQKELKFQCSSPTTYNLLWYKIMELTSVARRRLLLRRRKKKLKVLKRQRRATTSREKSKSVSRVALLMHTLKNSLAVDVCWLPSHLASTNVAVLMDTS